MGWWWWSDADRRMFRRILKRQGQIMAGLNEVNAALDALDTELSKVSASLAKLATEVANGLDTSAVVSRIQQEAANIEAARVAADPDAPTG